MADWIAEVRTQDLESRFHVWAGAVRRTGEELGWLVDALAGVARASGWPDARSRELDMLADRLAHGVLRRLEAQGGDERPLGSGRRTDGGFDHGGGYVGWTLGGVGTRRGAAGTRPDRRLDLAAGDLPWAPDPDEATAPSAATVRPRLGRVGCSSGDNRGHDRPRRGNEANRPSRPAPRRTRATGDALPGHQAVPARARWHSGRHRDRTAGREHPRCGVAVERSGRRARRHRSSVGFADGPGIMERRMAKRKVKRSGRVASGNGRPPNVRRRDRANGDRQIMEQVIKLWGGASKEPTVEAARDSLRQRLRKLSSADLLRPVCPAGEAGEQHLLQLASCRR